MQIVIDIPDDDYNTIIKQHGNYNIFKNGEVLPRKHGDLIDTDVFFDNMYNFLEQHRGFSLADIECVARIYTPAVVKSNK